MLQKVKANIIAPSFIRIGFKSGIDSSNSYRKDYNPNLENSIKYFTILLLVAFALTASASSSVIKNAIIEGQEYRCRPANIEPACNINTDFGFTVSLAADSADAMLCLSEVGSSPTKVKDCFLQKRIRQYAQEFDIQMISPNCWNIFLSKCTENTACPVHSAPQKRCGHLGEFLNIVRSNGLASLFSEADGIELCKSIAGQ